MRRYLVVANRSLGGAELEEELRKRIGEGPSSLYVIVPNTTAAHYYSTPVGGGSSKRRRTIEPATLLQLDMITQAMPERLRLAVLLGPWCALRYGEMAELRRSDIDLDRGILKVRRGAVWLKGKTMSGSPKTPAGARDVAYPPHLGQAIREHLANHGQPGNDCLLFPSQSGQPISPSAFFKPWKKARETAERPDLRFHDLRHTGSGVRRSRGRHSGRTPGPPWAHNTSGGNDLPTRS
jgi:integrase